MFTNKFMPWASVWIVDWIIIQFDVISLGYEALDRREEKVVKGFLFLQNLAECEVRNLVTVVVAISFFLAPADRWKMKRRGSSKIMISFSLMRVQEAEQGWECVFSDVLASSLPG